MIKCIIVEDEELAQDVIRRHLERSGALELMGVFRSPMDALNTLAEQDIDLMFLDIRLPGMSGLHFLSTLKDPPLVILTTAYSEYALESYDFNVIDYLLKPISYERFYKAIQKIGPSRLLPGRPEEGARDHMFVKSGGKFFKVYYTEIIYIQGMRDYLKICAEGYTLVTLQTMGEMEKILPPDAFIRVHRSYIVAVSRIRSIQGSLVELDRGSFPVSLNYRDAVLGLAGKKGP